MANQMRFQPLKSSINRSSVQSAKGSLNDPIRQQILDILKQIPALTKVPTAQVGVKKQPMAGDHIAYWYTEPVDHVYTTIEFHVDPTDPDAPYTEIYIITEEDGVVGDSFIVEDLYDITPAEINRIDDAIIDLVFGDHSPASKQTAQLGASYRPSRTFSSRRTPILSYSKTPKEYGRVRNIEPVVATDENIHKLVRDEIEKHGPNVDLNFIDVSNVTNMFRLFEEMDFNGDIGMWNTWRVTNMRRMFYNNKTFNQDLSGWDTSKVTDMGNMFQGAESFNGDISGFDTSKVRNMSNMFSGATSFNQDISGWDTSNVENMHGMFNSAESFNQDLGDWDTSNVTDMGFMFANAKSFNYSLEHWDVSKVTQMEYMFNGASSFYQPLDNWDVFNVRSMPDIFEGSGMKTLPEWYPENPGPDWSPTLQRHLDDTYDQY